MSDSVIEMRRAGATYTAIMSETGLSKSKLSTILAHHGPVKRQERKIDVDVANALRARGVPQIEMARRFGVSGAAVCLHFKRRGF